MAETIPFALLAMNQSSRLWLCVHLGLGLAWIALLASRAPTASGIGANGPQVFVMLVSAGWLPSWALACWQVRHRRGAYQERSPLGVPCSAPHEYYSKS